MSPEKDQHFSDSNQGSDAVDRLAVFAQEQAAQLSPGAYGATRDNMEVAAQAAELAQHAKGGPETIQHEFETIHPPRGWEDHWRDAQVEVHRKLNPNPSREQQTLSANILQISIADDLRTLNGEGKVAGDPEVDALLKIREAIEGRSADYFSDETDETGASGHARYEAGYEAAMGYIGRKLRRAEGAPAERAEAFRLARDHIHTDRQALRAEYESQDAALAKVEVAVGGADNADFPLAEMRRRFRSLLGESLAAAQSVVDMAQRARDPYERMTLLTDLATGRIPVGNEQEFANWRARHIEQVQQEGAQNSRRLAEAARQRIRDI